MPSPLIRRHFLAQGIVQGVGFRPFVARLARDLDLTGHVENTGRGVEIEVQGSPASVARFQQDLRGKAPIMALVRYIEASDLLPAESEGGFEIRASRVDPVSAAVVPPDIATCPACLSELDDPSDRRFGYPFVNCTDCGPRYTIIAALPYDRDRTSMARFAMCPLCSEEYHDPSSRRFHAQPNACPACGPRLTALDGDGAELPGDALEEAVDVLRAGGVVALLGLGGFHLACDGARETTVAALRRLKTRPAKPFAVMVPDLGSARALAELDPEAERLLAGPRSPILLVPARPGGGLAPSVAPGQDRLGLFLPYTPLHHLLFRAAGLRALVMTSGNRSDEPILANRDEALAKLRGVADLFLVHDRPILHRVDDSVVKTMEPLGPVVLRRARGYAPAPVPLRNPSGTVVLAVGGELANAVCVVRGNDAYLGAHVGDLKNLDVEEEFRAGIDHLLDLLQVRPTLVACDLHPRYRSSLYAAELEARGLPVLRVQHHEAHAAGCMAENGFEGDGIALALDGLGLGADGTLWGGEIMAGRPGRFARVGHLVPVPQPGGDRAAREPWRMAASHLRRLLGAGWKDLPLPAFQSRRGEERDALDAMMVRGVQSPLTSSCGRLFDAAAAILGFSGSLLYSAQAAMELEALAARGPETAPYLPGELTAEGDCLVLDPGPLLCALLADVLAGRDRGACALAFHRGLAGLLAAGAAEAAARAGVADVFLTGGCVQNAVLLNALWEELNARGLAPHTHREVPPNDGGLAYGQAAWAAAAHC